ncbi:hypothetical protein niasHS_012927 [Heterodera schachtii]|uniref:ShKT domain-containing protein n=2 Tax=Heterodera TaxID=34509 RepID=A0ABD2IL51_HETSC
MYEFHIHYFIFEIALRAIDPSVAVPYWDSTMDQRLDDPADSIMWTNLFLGSSDDDGYVVDGFLANWITSNGDRVQRNLGIDGELLAEDEIIHIITNRRYENVFGFPSRKAKNTECTLPMTKAQDLLEFNHNNVHTWIGGDMEKLPTSPQDPIFFMHHAFVDFIWEQWRQNWQSREERETQFPPEAQIVPCSGSRNYLLNATMLPFYDPVVLNRVGLSNDYTDFLYSFAPRPTCKSAGGCGSPYLFCDTTTNGTAFCCAKIKRGGNCAKFQKNSEEPCYDSFCINGKCQAANYGEKHFLNVVHSSDQSLSDEPSSSSIGTSTLPGFVADGTDHHVNFTTPSSSPQFSSVTSAQQTLLYDETSTVSNTVGNNTVELLTITWPTPSLPNERECFDNHECCAHWAANGSCRAAPRFMNTWCPASCRYDGCRPHTTEGQGIQKDVLSQCKRWAHSHEKKGHGEGWHAFKPGCVLTKPTTRSECQRNRHWMARNCPEACGCEFVRELLDKCSKNMPEDYKLEPIDE